MHLELSLGCPCESSKVLVANESFSEDSGSFAVQLKVAAKVRPRSLQDASTKRGRGLRFRRAWCAKIMGGDAHLHRVQRMKLANDVYQGIKDTL